MGKNASSVSDDNPVIVFISTEKPFFLLPTALTFQETLRKRGWSLCFLPVQNKSVVDFWRPVVI